MPKNTFLKFYSLALQICISVFLAAYLGKRVDLYYHCSKPYFSGGFVMLAVVGNVYSLIKQLR